MVFEALGKHSGSIIGAFGWSLEVIGRLFVCLFGSLASPPIFEGCLQRFTTFCEIEGFVLGSETQACAFVFVSGT